jgi:hypothetical protein
MWNSQELAAELPESPVLELGLRAAIARFTCSSTRGEMRCTRRIASRASRYASVQRSVIDGMAARCFRARRGPRPSEGNEVPAKTDMIRILSRMVRWSKVSVRNCAPGN